MNDILAGLAPTLASAILGPLGGVAVAALGKIFGIENATTADLTKAFQDGRMTPDQLTAIKQLEMKYQNDEKERGFKFAELEYKNQDSARQMQMATHSKMPAVLTVMVTIGFFGILSLLFFHPELKGNEIVMMMVGQLSAVWAGCVAFYTGTTFGSANKNAMLANKA